MWCHNNKLILYFYFPISEISRETDATYKLFKQFRKKNQKKTDHFLKKTEKTGEIMKKQKKTDIHKKTE